MVKVRSIRALMAHRGIGSQRELARHMGIKESAVSRLMNKNIWGPATLDRLCRALQCQPGDVIEYVPGD